MSTTGSSTGGPTANAPGSTTGGTARGAEETRRALLTAAEELFTSAGYDRTSVRAIADRAGVNQALLFRYFGNKEALFAQVVAAQGLDVLHGGPPEELLERTLRSILLRAEGGGESGGLFDSALRSAASSEAVNAVRDELGTAYTKAFAALADGGRAPGSGTEGTVATGGTGPADAALRAELLLGWMLGINLLRNVFRSEAVASADPDVVVGHVSRAAAALLHDGGTPVDSDRCDS
ncbi:TetR family transcriptional regulator [Pseudonocardia sediminis]|uniref:TetR family transcriptional regulator n=1 Tax=Pseudonocardia sediminis TaxID=1397368 RepID=A0A4Q7UTL8_PSEST|nr:TetR/AcrR family transcriptional regulator [Pseudonocardia sediminis]RZT85075.1 TetR family transcriptional regulator [Pseudonocardia sediminis]